MKQAGNVKEQQHRRRGNKYRRANTTKVKRRGGRRAGVGVELQTEIEGFHLPTASLCLAARPVIKEAASRAP